MSRANKENASRLVQWLAHFISRDSQLVASWKNLERTAYLPYSSEEEKGKRLSGLLREWICTKKKDIVVVGLSGVGKSFLVNVLLEATAQDNKEASDDGFCILKEKRNPPNSSRQTRKPSAVAASSSSSSSSSSAPRSTSRAPQKKVVEDLDEEMEDEDGFLVIQTEEEKRKSRIIAKEEPKSSMDFDQEEEDDFYVVGSVKTPPTQDVAMSEGDDAPMEDEEDPEDEQDIEEQERALRDAVSGKPVTPSVEVWSKIDWDRETASSEALAKYFKAGRATSPDDQTCYFLLQGGAAMNVPHVCAIKYGSICEAEVKFVSEDALRKSLWRLHEKLNPKGKPSTPSGIGLEIGDQCRAFLEWQYGCLVEGAGKGKLCKAKSPADIPLVKAAKTLLGKTHHFRGTGENMDMDRIFIREVLRNEFTVYGPIISKVSLWFPAGILQTCREICVADCDSWNVIPEAPLPENPGLVLAAIDRRGLTADLTEFLVSKNLLQAHISSPEENKFLVVELFERSLVEMRREGWDPLKEAQRLSSSTELQGFHASLAESVKQTFMRLMPADQPQTESQRAVRKALESLQVVTAWPYLYRSLAANSNVPKLDSQSAKTATQVPVLLATIQNSALTNAASKIRDFSNSWVVRVNDGLRSKATNAAAAASIAKSPARAAPVPTTSVPTSAEVWNLLQTTTDKAVGYITRAPFVSAQEGFAKAATATTTQAHQIWPAFRDTYLSSGETILLVLDPRYEGECLGSNLIGLVSSAVVEFACGIWAENVVRAISEAEERLREVCLEVLDMCGRMGASSLAVSPNESVHFRQLVWQYKEIAGQAVREHFGQLRASLAAQGLGQDARPAVMKICKATLSSTLLGKATQQAQNGAPLPLVQEMVRQSLDTIPQNCCLAIQSLFSAALTKATDLHIGSMSKQVQHLVRCLLVTLNPDAAGPAGTAPTAIPPAYSISSSSPSGLSPVALTRNGPSQQSASSTDVVVPASQLLLPQNRPLVAILSGLAAQTYEESHEEFAARLASMGLGTVETVPGPSSQFRSVAHFLFKTQEAHSVVRIMAALELLSKPALYEPLVDPALKLQLYTAKVSKDTTAGDHASLLALAASAKVDIILYSPSLVSPVRLQPPSMHSVAPQQQPVQNSSRGAMRIAVVDGYYRPVVPLPEAEQAPSSSSSSAAPPPYDQHLSRRATSIPSLADLCVQTLARDFCRTAPSSGYIYSGLPTDMVQRIITRMSDEPSVDAVDFDLSLKRLLHDGVSSLDLSHCPHFTKMSCSIVASACPSLQLLNLSFCSDVSDQAVCSLAEGCRELRAVSLESCNLIGDSVMVALARFCPSLVSLNISSCQGISPAGVHAIVTQCPNLTSLEARSCPAIVDGAFQGQGILQSLQHLDLTGCGKLTDAVFTLIPVRQLLTLKLSSRNFTDKNLATFIASCGRTLEQLSLSGCVQLGPFSLQAILYFCPRLQRLSLAGCINLRDSMFSDSSRSAAAGKQPFAATNLKALSFADCQGISDSVISAFAKQCRDLSSLDLSGCAMFTDQGLCDIAAQLPSSLIRINLSKCSSRITDAGISAIAQSSGMVLEELGFSSCRGVTDATLAVLSTCCPNLRTLDASHCPAITDEGLARVLRSCEGMVELSIEGCGLLTDSSLHEIVHSPAGQASRIRVLNAGYLPKITDSGIFALAGQAGLETLDLSHCAGITHSTLLSVASTLRRLHTLTARGVAFGANGFSSHQDAARLRSTVRSLDVSWSRGLGDNEVCFLALSVPTMVSLNLARCEEVSDIGMQFVVQRCPRMRQLNLSGCARVSPSFVRMLTFSGIAVSY